MKIFRIENIKFDPLVIIAPDNSTAADIFVGRIAAGIGNAPDATWETTEWRPRRNGENGSLLDVAREGMAGFAYPTKDGWKIFPPLWEIKGWG